MNKKFLENGNERILRITAGEEADRAYELRMITNSQPKELLPVHVSREQGYTELDYKVTGLASLKDCEGRDAAEYLYSVVFALERLGETLGELLLSPDRVILSPELIFLKKETGTVYFCYFPGKEESFQESVQTLMEYFLKIIEPLGEAEVLLLYGLYQKTREANVRPRTLADYWRENRGNEKIPEEETLSLTTRVDGAPASIPGREEQSLYRDLGLETRTESRPFMKWKASQRNLLEGPEEEDVIRYEDLEEEKKVIMQESKLSLFFKKNAIELAAAVVVMAGIVLYLSR